MGIVVDDIVVSVINSTDCRISDLCYTVYNMPVCVCVCVRKGKAEQKVANELESFNFVLRNVLQYVTD